MRLLLIVLIFVAGCDDDDSSADSAPAKILWINHVNSQWVKTISPENSGGFVTFCTSSWYNISAELYRFSADGEMIDSASISDLAEDHSYAAFAANNGGMWVAFQHDGIVLQQYSADLDLVSSIVVADVDWRVQAMAGTSQGLVIACQTKDTTVLKRAAIVSTDLSGGLISANVLEYSLELPDTADVRDATFDIVIASPGITYLSGARYHYHTETSIAFSKPFLVKTSFDGSVAWSWVGGADDEMVHRCVSLSSGGILIAYRTSDSDSLAFAQFSPEGLMSPRHDLTSVFERASNIAFVKASRDRLYCIYGFGNGWGDGATVYVHSLTGDGTLVSSLSLPNGIAVTDAALLSDGGIAIGGWYPTDVFPFPASLGKLRL